MVILLYFFIVDLSKMTILYFCHLSLSTDYWPSLYIFSETKFLVYLNTFLNFKTDCMECKTIKSRHAMKSSVLVINWSCFFLTVLMLWLYKFLPNFAISREPSLDLFLQMGSRCGSNPWNNVSQKHRSQENLIIFFWNVILNQLLNR